MSAQVEEFIARLIEGPSLRAEFGQAPRETAERAGLELSDDDLKALRTVDWGDEQIVAAASRRNMISACNPSDVNLKENIVPIRWE